jgi:hypothetical protein
MPWKRWRGWRKNAALAARAVREYALGEDAVSTEKALAAGVNVRTVLINDEIASAPRGQEAQRRGTTADHIVIKIAGAALRRCSPWRRSCARVPLPPPATPFEALGGCPCCRRISIIVSAIFLDFIYLSYII